MYGEVVGEGKVVADAGAETVTVSREGGVIGNGWERVLDDDSVGDNGVVDDSVAAKVAGVEEVDKVVDGESASLFQVIAFDRP